MSGERQLRELRLELHLHLDVGAFATPVHSASSSASILPNSSGVPILISAPSLASRARVSGGVKAFAERGVELVDDRGRRAGRRHDAEPERRLQFRESPPPTTVGTSGRFGLRTLPAIAIGRSLPAWICGRMWSRVGDDLDLAGEDRGEHRRGAAIGHVHDIDAGFELEQFEQQVRRGAEALRAPA